MRNFQIATIKTKEGLYFYYIWISGDIAVRLERVNRLHGLFKIQIYHFNIHKSFMLSIGEKHL